MSDTVILFLQESQDGKTCFVKIHVPWPVLLTWAERMKVKMPLKVEKDDNEDNTNEKYCDCSFFEKLKKKLISPFQLHNELINQKVCRFIYFYLC